MTKIEQKIPEGWSVKRLGDICTFSNGKAHENDVCEKGKYILVNSKFVSSDGKIQKRVACCYSPLCKEDIAIVMSDVPNGRAIAKCFYIDENDKYTLNQRIGRLMINHQCSMFIFYIVSRNSYFLKFDDGINQTNLRKNQILNCPILLPPLPEQEKIAGILSCWDDGIEKLSALIEKKKIQKKALMQQLLKKIKTTNMKRFDEIFKDYSIKNQPCEKLLSATQDRGVLPRDMLQGRVMSPEGSLAGYKLVNIGDFVISLRSFQGGFEYSNYKGIISPAYTVLKNIINIDKQFYRHFFKSYEFIEKYLSIAVVGIRDGKQISYQDLCSVKIPYPDLAEQKAIAEILSKADEEIELLNKKLEAFKQEKKALMQQLLTGKIRVKVN